MQKPLKVLETFRGFSLGKLQHLLPPTRRHGVGITVKVSVGTLVGVLFGGDVSMGTAVAVG